MGSRCGNCYLHSAGHLGCFLHTAETVWVIYGAGKPSLCFYNCILWGETEQHWKSIWETEVSHYTNAQRMVDLRADHSNLLEQEPVTITMADI